MSEGYVAWDLHDAARAVAEIGAHVARHWFGRGDLAVDLKGDASPVTQADREAETAMRGAIAQRFPDHAILGEEHGGELNREGITWILDPIDGTKSFIHRVPLFTTLVAVIRDGVPLVGVIANPMTGELVSAVSGGGCFDERGERTWVESTTPGLSDAWLMTTDPAELLRRRPNGAPALLERAGHVRTWADAYAYLLLASGRASIAIDPIMSPWDIAPLSVIVREAGGVFSSLDGNRDDLGTSALAVSNERLHREVVDLIAG